MAVTRVSLQGSVTAEHAAQNTPAGEARTRTAIILSHLPLQEPGRVQSQLPGPVSVLQLLRLHAPGDGRNHLGVLQPIRIPELREGGTLLQIHQVAKKKAMTEFLMRVKHWCVILLDKQLGSSALPMVVC